MTDNRTTELLRKLLDEHGARYEKSEDDTTIYYDDDGNRYTYNVNPDSGWAQLFGYNLTPEQAIAATLGSEREKELEELVRDLLQLRCRQSCADCEHEDDEGCDFMTRAIELGIIELESEEE